MACALGALSFPLYAVHYPVIQLLNLPWGPALLAALGAVVACKKTFGAGRKARS